MYPIPVWVSIQYPSACRRIDNGIFFVYVYGMKKITLILALLLLPLAHSAFADQPSWDGVYGDTTVHSFDFPAWLPNLPGGTCEFSVETTDTAVTGFRVVVMYWEPASNSVRTVQGIFDVGTAASGNIFTFAVFHGFSLSQVIGQPLITKMKDAGTLRR